MVEFTEVLREAFESGGKAALLGDLYLDGETLRVCAWDEPIDASEPVSGGTKTYTPCPFAIVEDEIVREKNETGIVTVFMGIVVHSDTDIDQTDEFTAAQLAQFTNAMDDVDKYLEQNDIRGSLTILRIVNVDDTSETWKIFTGIVDDYEVNRTGISIQIAEPNDIIDAPIYPVSTMCPYTFGDSRCGVDRDAAANLYQGTAESGSSASVIVDSNIDPSTDDYWKPGIVKGTSGSNKGIAREIKSYDSATTTITFGIPFPAAFAVGDTYDLRRRCKKTSSHCDETFSNLTRFGGYKDANQPIQGLFFRGR